MIVYNKTKKDFCTDVFTNEIDSIVASEILRIARKRIANHELHAFKNSLECVERVLQDNEIPDDCGISIEYHIPQTSKRIDLIISGLDKEDENVIIIELKQWEESKITNKDGIVITRFQGKYSETSHPSYQAYSYAALLHSFNTTVDAENINLYPCAYLHNYYPDNVITNDFYKYYLEKAPVFLKNDAPKLRAFIKGYIKKGDKGNILYRIDHGKIRPTKSLADSLAGMLKGNKEFIMIDDQKVVYENALHLAINSCEGNKNVLIIEGGPGTGKSVIAVNLLVELIRKGIMTQYVTKTSAPRDVYFNKLSGEKRMIELRSLFVGSGSFISTPTNFFPVLIVDEAHRLTEKTGFMKRGDNQIKEIMNSAVCSVFFIDEDQRVHFEDYGESIKIEDFARSLGIKIHKLKLESQFRCNGSDGYLAWLDNVLQIRETANLDLNDIEFDFQIFDNPKELQRVIYENNKINNKARLVAGYCWDWKSKKRPQEYDIVFDEFDFKMRWNLGDYGGTWIIDPNSVTEIGCIHTAQGLEVDYIGVIIGEDLIIRDGEVIVDPSKRSTMDRTVAGWRKYIKEDPDYYKPLLKSIITNTYRTLMTRGMKGCYVYFVDKQTEQYFRDRIIR